tara:strand:- start:339 stop:506 length:168 start_codon:yes stop_codon:yes gene_type:complete
VVGDCNGEDRVLVVGEELRSTLRDMLAFPPELELELALERGLELEWELEWPPPWP